MPANVTPALPGPVVVDLPAGADLSPAIKAIESAYRQFAKAVPGAPAVTIVVKRDERAWGHTTVAKVWAANGTETADRFEIMISGENLARGGEAVMATLLHEAAHACNLAEGVLDTDVNGRHNRKFADRAESHGLDVAENGWHGWTATTMSDDGRKRWARAIKTVDAGLAKAAAAATPNIDHLPTPEPVAVPGAPVIVVGGRARPVTPRKRGNRNLIKGVCECGYSIRASRGVYEQSAPKCSECGSEFLPDA
jgi:hypothetical protein